MFQVTAFYEAPTKPDDFDQHYSTVHVELIRRLPGLRHATANWPVSGDEPPRYHQVAVMYWDDRESAFAALASPAGRAAAEDAQNLQCENTFKIFAHSEPVIPFTTFAPGSEVCGVLGLYRKPADPAAFRAHYERTHCRLAAKMPKQAAFTVNWTTSEASGSPPRYHLIGNQEWASQEDFDFCIQSGEATAAVADLDNFADAGITILASRSTVVI
jgi:uncharacterized protein (TIGR02118 family)